jgi:ribose transport system substrate-binding protein
MKKIDPVRKNGLMRRAFMSAGLALGVTILGGALGVPAVARGAEGGAKGKTVGYITFGLQFEYQIAMVDGIKKKAGEAGLVMQIVDGKGDPNLQVTEVLDAVSRNRARCWSAYRRAVVAGKTRQQANIPVFVMATPPEGNT